MFQDYNIAVLLSVYKNDKAEFLRLSIDSILNQSYKNIILYIGVDGTIGEKLYKCLEQYEQEKRVNIVYFPENRGLAVVLNDLLILCKEANIEYIVRMDADDISVPNRLANQVNYLLLHPEVDVVGGRIEEINEQSERNGKSVTYPLTHQECFKFFRYRDPLAHPAVMFRKSFFDKAKGYRNEYRKNQDTMLWFDGFMNGCIFANLDETVLLFRVTDDFYKNRRNGFKRAKKMLKDRFMINKALHYDWSAYLFSFLMFIMTLTPPFLKKFLYRIR
ncbi:glycosyltransferase [Bacteroides cellulosilyticus]|jgi:glycosyltransferase involved in cell wall biosynthesis|uniref:glycosyltransferase n=1 Tax=Bacteroides cellulosilyticus TaxID=246787 RepID=UPI0018AC966E|nr:glycosyltransferase [Bacteroides cellulosilyticus]